MTPILYALNRIKREIPPQILSTFFTPRHYGQNRRDAFMPGNIENLIIEKVINGIVRPDCDVAGVLETTIPLSGINPEVVDTDKYLLHIPKSHTNGREITSAIALIYYGVNSVLTNGGVVAQGLSAPYTTGSSTNTTYNLMQSTTLNPVRTLANTNQPMTATETTNVEIVDGNTVLVRDFLYPNQNSYLRCILSHDREFSSLPPAAWNNFGKLCVYACKMYIYNYYIIDIDSAELSGGSELGKFKDIVESYSEAAELYNEFYNDVWRKVQFMADGTRYSNYIKSMIGRYK